MNPISMQPPKIPVLGPYEVKCFSRYFKGVDLLLAKRFSFGFVPDEEHLTLILCELLDERASKLHLLPYSLSDLNNDLTKNGGLLHTEFSISTTDYNKRQEGCITQSDIGIVLEYQDYIEPNNNFSNAMLLQAKKLFLANSDYNLSSIYESFDTAQHERLEELNKSYVEKGCGNECIKYLMYNPSLEAIPKHEQQKVLHQQMKLDATSIFDYTIGLQRYKELIEGEQSSIINLGCLFTSIDNIHELATKAAKASKRTKQTLCKFTLGSLIESINVYKSSLSWFFVFDLMMRGVGCSCEDFIELVRYGKKTGRARELEIAPPKYCIKLRITAGSEQ